VRLPPNGRPPGQQPAKVLNKRLGSCEVRLRSIGRAKLYRHKKLRLPDRTGKGLPILRHPGSQSSRQFWMTDEEGVCSGKQAGRDGQRSVSYNCRELFSPGASELIRQLGRMAATECQQSRSEYGSHVGSCDFAGRSIAPRDRGGWAYRLVGSVKNS